MEKLNILLSVSEYDIHFQQMKEELSNYANVDVYLNDDYSLNNYDIFIGKLLKKEKLIEANKLKIIFAYKTGVDDFPLDELKEKGIILINSHADSKIIAEYAFGLSVSLVNRITEFDHYLREGIWYQEENDYWKSIFNMKIGLFGYGHIGKNIHQILLNNNIETYTIDRNHDYENINLVKDINELIEKTDLIICSVPKTNSTNNIFNKKTFKMMKNKYLVNVGRSNVINQKDLFEALNTKQLSGAAIDTWDKKPKNKKTKLLPSLVPFQILNNIILSPHAAMRVEDGHEKYVKDTTLKVINYITKNELTDIVSLDKGY